MEPIGALTRAGPGHRRRSYPGIPLIPAHDGIGSRQQPVDVENRIAEQRLRFVLTPNIFYRTTRPRKPPPPSTSSRIFQSGGLAREEPFSRELTGRSRQRSESRRSEEAMRARTARPDHDFLSVQPLVQPGTDGSCRLFASRPRFALRWGLPAAARFALCLVRTPHRSGGLAWFTDNRPESAHLVPSCPGKRRGMYFGHAWNDSRHAADAIEELDGRCKHGGRRSMRMERTKAICTDG